MGDWKLPRWVADQREAVRERARRDDPAMQSHEGDPGCVCADGLARYRDVTECCGNVNGPDKIQK